LAIPANAPPLFSSRIVGSNSKIIAEPSFFHGGPRQIFHIPDKTTELVRVVR
jgi:hypothetical protein